MLQQIKTFLLQKKIISIISIALTVSVLAVLMILVKNRQTYFGKAGVSGPNLYISPSTKNTVSGENFSVQIVLDTYNSPISAVNIELTLDPSQIEVVGFVPSSSLPVVLSQVAKNSNQVNFALGASPGLPYTGVGTIGTLNLKALSASKSDINFSSKTTIASVGKNSNVLSATTGIQLNNNSITEPPTPAPVVAVEIYRAYSQVSNDVIITTDPGEKAGLLKAGWTSLPSIFRGWQTKSNSQMVPLFRLNKLGSGHIYTTSEVEKNAFVQAGYTYEGIAFYVYSGPRPETIPVYRMSKLVGTSLKFRLVTSDADRNSSKSLGFKDEGVAFYAGSL